MATKSVYGADLGGRDDPNPVVRDEPLPLITDRGIPTHVIGRLDNATSAPTAGIRLTGSYAKPGSWIRYLDFAAAGASPVLKHEKLSLNADGTSSFTGNLNADTVAVGSGAQLVLSSAAPVGLPWIIGLDNNDIGTATSFSLQNPGGTDVLRIFTSATWNLPIVASIGNITAAAGACKSQIGTAASTAKHVYTLFADVDKTTTSTSLVSVTSFSLPANALSANGQVVRILAQGIVTTQAGTSAIKFGATTLATITVAVGQTFYWDATIVRTSATTQEVGGFFLNNNTLTSLVEGSHPAATLSGAVTIDFQGSVTSGGTLRYRSVRVLAEEA